MKGSYVYLLIKLLTSHAIKIDKEELAFQLESHPSYPSLHSLTGVLDHFGIDNLALEVPKEEDVFQNLPQNFIAHIKDPYEHFVLVEKKGNRVKMIYDTKKEKTIDIESFLELWTGILLVIEKGSETKTVKNKAWGKAIYYMVALGFLAFFFWKHLGLFQSLHLALSIIGGAISALIVWHELGNSSVILEKFCFETHKKFSCDQVLKSKGANLFWGIKFSDVGIVYFLGTSLSWFLLSLAESENYSFLAILSLVAIPFTFYSLAYQRYIVKKWCPLCLTILLVLCAQALCVLVAKIETNNLLTAPYSLFLIGQSFVLSIAAWYFILPKLKEEVSHKRLRVSYKRFKNNYKIFNALLSKQEQLYTEIEETSEIILGNKKSPLKIMLITNPLCRHCKKAYHATHIILSSKSQSVGVCLRFNVNAKDKNNLATKIAMRILQIYHQQGEKNTMLALYDIYNDFSPSQWLKKWGPCKEAIYLEELYKEKKWCNKNKLNFTPVLLLNGRIFPNEYEWEDLPNFIDGEIEKIENFVSEANYA